MSSNHLTDPYTERTECLPVDIAIAKAFSKENMPDLTRSTRLRVIQAVSLIEGSSQTKALTCVSHTDIDRIREAVESQLDLSREEVDEIHAYPIAKKIQGNIRSLNQHCENCATADCAHRTDLTLDEIRERSQSGRYLNSRRAKVQFPKAKFDDELRSGVVFGRPQQDAE